MSDFITGSVITLLSFVLGLFGNMWYANIQEKKRRQNEGLKNHFTLLEEKIIQPLTDNLFKLKYNYGEISPEGQGRHWSLDDSKIKILYETELHESFKLHYFNFYNQLENFEKEINTHNEKYDNFVNEIEKTIANWSDTKYGHKAPCVYPEIVRDYIYTIFDKVNKSKLSYNFPESIVSQYGDFWRISCRSLNGSFVVYADFTSEEQGTIFIEKLTSYLELPELQSKALLLAVNGIRLNTDALRLGSELDTMCWEFSILGRTLKEVNECKYCRVIYDKEHKS